MTELGSIMFYLLAGLTIVSAVAVVLVSNPIYSALLLAVTMVCVSAVFFTLDAYFIAATQLIIYAGAVMVLFVMVIMLFNLREEKQAFSRGVTSFVLKMAASGFVLGLLLSAIAFLVKNIGTPARSDALEGMEATRKVALHLFTKYTFGFEVIGVLLLVVLVGAIALARSKGGTHA